MSGIRSLGAEFTDEQLEQRRRQAREGWIGTYGATAFSPLVSVRRDRPFDGTEMIVVGDREVGEFPWL